MRDVVAFISFAVIALSGGACGGEPVASPAAPSPLPASVPAVRQCPGTVVGTVPGRPDIRIVGLQPGAARVQGTATNIDARDTRVVLWAKTDQWYVQPFIATPFTNVCSDGSWSSSTHPWSRIVALLVDKSHVPGSTRQTHPAGESGVLAWDEYPSSAPDRVIEFAGHRWKVKNADLAGPGPNNFSDSEANIRVAGDGLHLAITQRDGRWYSAEVFAERSLGYGSYTFQVATRLDALDYQAVFAGFVYETNSREVDIEFSHVLANPNFAQFVVQPYSRPGNLLRFDMRGIVESSHRFVWHRDRIEFASWAGLDPEPRAGTLLRSWIYEGPDTPPAGSERMRFNLWLFGGQPPHSGRGDEVVVRGFRFQP